MMPTMNALKSFGKAARVSATAHRATSLAARTLSTSPSIWCSSSSPITTSTTAISSSTIMPRVVARLPSSFSPTSVVASSGSLRRFHHDDASESTNDGGMTTLKETYEYIVVEKHYAPNDNTVASKKTTSGGVGWIQLHRPKALNALCDGLFADLLHAALALDQDPTIGCLVISGSRNSKAFAAGADIKEMSTRTFDQVYTHNMFAEWTQLSQRIGKPIVAAVHGYCLGGGCELAMMCDIVVASRDAQFGQPEINLGVIPGAGGTQRLIRALGKSKAMHLILTGERISATELETTGLLAKLYDTPDDMWKEVIEKIGLVIASKGGMAVAMAKEAVNAAEELSLSQGLRLERRLFHSLFATHDQKEGMKAFLEKRAPEFTNK